MSKTTEWSIKELVCYPEHAGQTNVVFSVKWRGLIRYIGDAGESYQAERSGTTNLAYVSGSPFTPYADLTESQIWGWVDAKLNRTEIESEMNTELDNMITPLEVSPSLPW